MKSGDKNGKGMNMVDTNIELILQHSSPLITHATQHLLPPHSIISIHAIVYCQTKKCHSHDPEQQNFGKPSPVGLYKCIPPFGPHLLPIHFNSHWVVVALLYTQRHRWTQAQQELKSLKSLLDFLFVSLTPSSYLTRKKANNTGTQHSHVCLRWYSLTR